MSDVPSTELTFDALGSPDKTLMRFGKANGHVADYGHCDLVWSRHAPREIFPPIIDWLDQRQPGRAATAQTTAGRRRVASRRASASSPEMSRCRSATRSRTRAAATGSIAMGRNSASASPSSRGVTSGSFELVDMHDAQVDAPDGRRVVVDQPDAADPARAGDSTSSSSSRRIAVS